MTENMTETGLTAESRPKTKTKPVKPGDELVTVHLFKDADRYMDDVTIGVNGSIIKVRRGEDVQIPRKYAEVLENSIRQDKKTAELIQKHTSAYAAEARKYNI